MRSSEKEFWDDICIDMLEESDDPDDPNVLIVHKPFRRSQGKFCWYVHVSVSLTFFPEMCDFLVNLDARY